MLIFLNNTKTITEKHSIERFALNHKSSNQVTAFGEMLFGAWGLLLQYLKWPLGVIWHAALLPVKYSVLIKHPQKGILSEQCWCYYSVIALLFGNDHTFRFILNF